MSAKTNGCEGAIWGVRQGLSSGRSQRRRPRKHSSVGLVAILLLVEVVQVVLLMALMLFGVTMMVVPGGLVCV